MSWVFSWTKITKTLKGPGNCEKNSMIHSVSHSTTGGRRHISAPAPRSLGQKQSTLRPPTWYHVAFLRKRLHNSRRLEPEELQEPVWVEGWGGPRPSLGRGSETRPGRLAEPLALTLPRARQGQASLPGSISVLCAFAAILWPWPRPEFCHFAGDRAAVVFSTLE